MSIAFFPMTVFRELDFRFFERITTLEDRQLTTSAALLCGVEASPEVTSVYRWWINAASSSFVHKADEWTANRLRVLDQRDVSAVLLPAGFTHRIATLIDERDSLTRECAAYRDQIAEWQGESARLRDDVDRLRTEAETLQAEWQRESSRLRDNADRWRTSAEASQRDLDSLRSEIDPLPDFDPAPLGLLQSMLAARHGGSQSLYAPPAGCFAAAIVRADAAGCSLLTGTRTRPHQRNSSVDRGLWLRRCGYWAG